MLSTLSTAPPACAISAAPAMSEMRIMGLVGVSTCTRRVLGRMAARISSRLPLSTKENSIPSRAKTLAKSRKVPP